MRDFIDKITGTLIRRVDLIVWVLVLQAIVLIPFLILAQGYLPGDDCLRHAAKAVDGRPWGEILVLRPGILDDPHAAWHFLLRGVHLVTGWGPEGLVTLTVAGLFVLMFIAPLPWLSAPEAWIAGWLFLWLGWGPQVRLMLGRPFLVPVAALLALMGLWTRSARGTTFRLVLSILLFGVAALLHGSWYLLVMVPASFLLARRWPEGRALLLAWAAGSVLAALATGHPGQFLWGELLHMGHTMSGAMEPITLVGELNPSPAVGPISLTLVGILFYRLWEGTEERLVRDPVFLLAIVGWLLGLRVSRFWLDWGYPCTALWLAFQFEPVLARLRARAPLLRLGLTAGLCLAAVFAITANLANRWTGFRNKVFLTADHPGMAGWLPEPGGIIYSRGMEAFFETYFKNPHAPWRYMVGFEPSMMPVEDFAIYRRILLDPRDPATMKPWIAKMRPQDRLLTRSGEPGAGQFGLEWHLVGGDLWIGRLPRK